MAAGLALISVALVVLVFGALEGKPSAPPSGGRLAGPAAAGAAGVAAAYRYPLACLTVTLAVSEPAYASARLDRASPCWRYGAYTTAVFHRVGGVWRLILDAPSDSCPVAALAPAVQAQLGICQR